MYILVLPLVGLLIVGAFVGFIRAVRLAGRAETLGPPMTQFFLVLLAAVVLGLCLPLAFLRGEAVYGLSLLLYLFLRWLAGVALVTTTLEILHARTKKQSFRLASSAVLAAGGVLIVISFTVIQPILSLFGVTMKS